MPGLAGWMGPAGVARTEYEAGRGPGQRLVPAVENRRRLAAGRDGLMFEEHAGIMIRQVEQTSGEPDGDRVGRLQVEEPDTGVAVADTYIRSYIGLVEIRQSRYGGKSDRAVRRSW